MFEKRENSFNFHEVFLTEDEIVDVQDQIQLSVLQLLKRRSWIDNEEMEKMLACENSGFSLDAKVKIPNWDRESLERLQLQEWKKARDTIVVWKKMIASLHLPMPQVLIDKNVDMVEQAKLFSTWMEKNRIQLSALTMLDLSYNQLTALSSALAAFAIKKDRKKLSGLQ